MGSRFEVIARGDDRDHLLAAADEALDEIERLDHQLSHYRPGSDICHLNAHAADEPVRVEPCLFDLLCKAEEWSAATGGAFDITAGPLIKTWGFFNKQGHVPTEDELAAALKLVGMRNVELNREQGTVRFRQPGVEVHLGAVGKGFAVERACGILRELDVPGAVVHGGNSSIQAVGSGEDGEPWNIGVRHPLRDDGRLAALGLQDAALSMSGSTGDFFEVGGRRYSHLIDPRTGWPAEGLLACAAITDGAAEGDGLSTALFIMGLEAAREYCATRPDLGALLIPWPCEGDEPEMIALGIDIEP